jgi:hypothetical protein
MQADSYAILVRPGGLMAIQLDGREADELRDAGQTVLRVTLLDLVRLAGNQNRSLTVFPRDEIHGCHKYAALVQGIDAALPRAG